MPDQVHSAAIEHAGTHVNLGEDAGTRLNFSRKNPLFRLGDRLRESSWGGVLASLAIVALITMVGLWIEPVIGGLTLAIGYLLAAVFSALRWGRLAVAASAISSVLAFDYCFVTPRRSVAAGDAWYLGMLIGLLFIGVIVSALVVAAHEEASAARRSEMRISALYSFSKSLMSGNDLNQILDIVVHHFREVFGRPVVVLLPEAERLSVRRSSAGLVLSDGESAIARWVFENGQEAGAGTDSFSGSKMRYRPLTTGQGIVGVIGLLTLDSKQLLPPDQRELLGVFMNQTALAIVRADLARKAQRAEILQEADKLQKALLNSVSHNLRTPLASVLGVLGTVLEDGALLDASTQRSLLATAQDEAKRLDWLVQNLLDMTRLEGGALRAKTEPCDVRDVVGTALHQLGDAARNHRILVSIAPDLPLVPMDNVLIVQVLVNLLDNALKYSPPDAPIEIEARLDTTYLEVQVLDRGKGIPEQEMERVFEKFYRVRVPGAPKGSGLGLSICKGFVEAHGGRIFAKRRPDGGTALVFTLPLEAKT